MDQIARTATAGGTFVVQVDPKLKERAAVPPVEGQPHYKPAQDAEVVTMLAPVRRDPGTVDADEIARLLATGEAASIDAAAAIASTTAPVALEEPPEKLSRRPDPQAIAR